jgi:hypothetical protein
VIENPFTGYILLVFLHQSNRQNILWSDSSSSDKTILISVTLNFHLLCLIIFQDKIFHETVGESRHELLLYEKENAWVQLVSLDV